MTSYLLGGIPVPCGVGFHRAFARRRCPPDRRGIPFL